MNFFKTGLQSVLGTGEVNETTSGAETVEFAFVDSIFLSIIEVVLGRKIS